MCVHTQMYNTCDEWWIHVKIFLSHSLSLGSLDSWNIFPRAYFFTTSLIILLFWIISKNWLRKIEVDVVDDDALAPLVQSLNCLTRPLSMPRDSIYSLNLTLAQNPVQNIFSQHVFIKLVQRNFFVIASFPIKLFNN